MKLAAIIIRWICIAFNLFCLVITILDSANVLSIPADISKNMMYAIYASWAIGIGTKFITDKKRKKSDI